MENLEVAAVQIFNAKDALEHHTDKFVSNKDLTFLRRGQLFSIKINFESIYDPETHRVYLEFSTGSDEKFETFAKFRVRCSLDKEREFPPTPSDWAAKRLDNSSEPSEEITVEVVSPVWLPVGRWQLRVHTRRAHSSRERNSTYTCSDYIYFLFNPWNEDDDTYFKDTALLEEYVLGDVGKICDGYNSWKVWDFGQFEECVLPAFEKALEEDGRLPNHLRGDPASLVRNISRIVNANEGGILSGKWHGSYEDGKAPWDWMGSADILRQYLETGEHVRYGQCWVFAGVAATICRALGIPARCVTNLASGHDRDTSLTIDIMYDEQLNEISGSDSIWNFHCWTDAWMRRPDLGKDHDYDGWQVMDATPQEYSMGFVQCGPAPLAAVLRGHTHVSFDVPFVFTEVNGDRARWIKRSDGKLRLIDVSEDLVGQMILTNEPLSEPNAGVADITSEYKYREGTDMERDVIDVATKNVRNSSGEAKRKRIKLQKHKHINDVRFQDETPSAIDFGENLYAVLKMQNTSEEFRNITVELIIECVDNQKRSIRFVKTTGTLVITLQPEGMWSQTMEVCAEEYAWVIQENQYLRLTAKCWVKETDQPWVSEQSAIQVYCPSLQIEVDTDLCENDLATATVSFDRPVDFPLTYCKLVVRGSAIGEEMIINLPDVPREDTFSANINFCPVRTGVQKITAKFTSAELPKAETWVQVSVHQSRLHDITHVITDRIVERDFIITPFSTSGKISMLA